MHPVQPPEPASAPTSPPGTQCDPLPTLQQEQQALAWLHLSPQLGREVTGYLCDALLDWTLHGGQPYPDLTPLPHELSDDHLLALTQIVDRFPRRITDAPSVADKLSLGRAGKLLRRAVQAASDPQAVRDAADRELLAADPALTSQLLPPTLGAGTTP